MRFPYMVNHNGTYYKAGEEVPTDLPEMTDNVPDGALDTHPDGSVNAYDQNNNLVGTVDAQVVVEATGNAPKRGRPAKTE